MNKIKATIIFVFVLLLSVVLVSCKDGELDFKTFADSLKLSDDSGISGYNQNILIKDGSNVVFEESRTLAPNGDAYKLTTQVLKRLNNLDSENQYSENETPVETNVSEVDNGVDIVFLKEYFEDDFSIDQKELIFSGTVKSDSVKSFMNDNEFTGHEVSVSIVLVANTFKLNSITISYVSQNNNVVTIVTTMNYV
jgi:hypothetical protein